MKQQAVSFTTKRLGTAWFFLSLEDRPTVVIVKGTGPWSSFTQTVTSILELRRAHARVSLDSSIHDISFECCQNVT